MVLCGCAFQWSKQLFETRWCAGDAPPDSSSNANESFPMTSHADSALNAPHVAGGIRMSALAEMRSREFFSILAAAAGRKLLPIKAEPRENLIRPPGRNYAIPAGRYEGKTLDTASEI